MIKIKCKICGKVIEGYSKRHTGFLMEQHKYKHRKEERENDNGDEQKDNA